MIIASPLILKKHYESYNITMRERQSGRHYPDEEPKGHPGSKCAYCKYYLDEPYKNCKTFCIDCTNHMSKGKVYLHTKCHAKWHNEDALNK